MLRLLQDAVSYSYFPSDRFVQVLAPQQITPQLVTGIAATARVWNPVLREHGQSEEAPGILRLESLKAFYCAFIVAFGKRDWSLGSPFLYHASNIRAQLLFGRGVYDARVKLEQPEDIAAIRGNRGSMAFVVHSDESHNFARSESNLGFCRIEEFLYTCLRGVLNLADGAWLDR